MIHFSVDVPTGMSVLQRRWSFYNSSKLRLRQNASGDQEIQDQTGWVAATPPELRFEAHDFARNVFQRCFGCFSAARSHLVKAQRARGTQGLG